jgi:hypothetical protein
MGDEPSPCVAPLILVHKQPSAVPGTAAHRASTDEPGKRDLFCTSFITHHMQRVAL